MVTLAAVARSTTGTDTHSDRRVAVDAPWVDSVVDIESLAGGGFVIAAGGTLGVLWSADGVRWLDADPQRLIALCEPLSLDTPPDEDLIAAVEDRVLVLDRVAPGVWLGDPESGEWETVRFDTGDLDSRPELLTIAGNENEALVVAKVPAHTSLGIEDETAGQHGYLIWLVDPVDGSTERHPLPITGSADFEYSIAEWFDGRWLLAITDAGTGSLLTSPDGASWTRLEWPAGWGSLTSMSAGTASVFLTTCHFGGDSFWYSLDGHEWARTASAFAGHDSADVEGHGFVVPCGGGIVVSTDGQSVEYLGSHPAGGAGHITALADRLLIANPGQDGSGS